MPARLSPRTQTAIVAGAALAASIGYVSLSSLGGSLADPPQYSAPATGAFRPTKLQWEGIETAVVGLRSFRPEVITDGKIAVDDDRTTPVFSPYSGRVVEVLAKSGEHVAKGAPLMAVQASELVQAQNDLIAAAAALDTARAQLKLTETAEKRQHALYLAKGAALKDWQQSQAELATAQSNVRSGEIALESVRNRLRILGKSANEIAAMEATPARRMNPVAKVVAPIAGTVTQRKVGLGQYISSGGDTSVYTIGDLSVVWLIANVREADAARIRLGEQVEVRVLAYPGRVFKAKLSWVASAIDADTHRLPVRADVENSDGALKPMMFANFAIITGPAVERPAVPEEAIVHEGETARVWLVRADGTIVRRVVKTGQVQHGMAAVLAGLAAGDKVVTNGSLFIDRAARGG